MTEQKLRAYLKRAAALLLVVLMLTVGFLADIPAKPITATATPSVSYVNKRGDANLDGEVTSADAYFALCAALNYVLPTQEQIEAGDMDGNGYFTAQDARLILRTAVGLEETVFIDTEIEVIPSSLTEDNSYDTDTFGFVFDYNMSAHQLSLTVKIYDYDKFKNGDYTLHYSDNLLKLWLKYNSTEPNFSGGTLGATLAANEEDEGVINLSAYISAGYGGPAEKNENYSFLTLRFDVIDNGTAMFSLEGRTELSDNSYKNVSLNEYYNVFFDLPTTTPWQDDYITPTSGWWDDDDEEETTTDEWNNDDEDEPTTAPYDDSSVKSIEYIPSKSYVFDDKLSCNEFGYYSISKRVGDILRVTYKDETVREFVYAASGDYDKYVCSDGAFIYSYEVDIYLDQYTTPLSAGEHSLEVTYDNKKCEVPVIINECPVKEISAEFTHSLYLDYNCTIGESFTSYKGYDGPDYANPIQADAVICTIEYRNGEKITTTFDNLYELFNRGGRWYVTINNAGKNEGTITIGTLIGKFTVNVEDSEEIISALPQYRVLAYELAVCSGEEIDIQLIEFADKSYSRELEIVYIPDGFTIDENGRFKGTVGNIDDNYYYSEYLIVLIRWEGTYVCPEVILHLTKKGEDRQTIPENVRDVHVNEFINVTATEENPQWFRFRATDLAAWITGGDGNKHLCTLYDKTGAEIQPCGYGDGYIGNGEIGFSAKYYFTKGEYYYIRATENCMLQIHSTWMPFWGDEKDVASPTAGEAKLIKLNERKSFSDDTNEYWNVYSATLSAEIDYGDGLGLWAYGTMARYISPVNIHTEPADFSASYELIDKQSYKYDPNNELECLCIGASTQQNTLKDSLQEGEKEYRFDNVYYFMPAKGKFTLEETIYLYVPVGYYLDDSKIVKHEKQQHTDADFDGRCDVCAELTGKKPVVTGDIDGDDRISADDARLALRASVGLEKYAPDTAEFKAADADRDGKLTADDARLILRASVGLETL